MRRVLFALGKAAPSHADAPDRWRREQAGTEQLTPEQGRHDNASRHKAYRNGNGVGGG